MPRIVTYREFLELPPGTIFSKTVEFGGYCDGLYRKENTAYTKGVAFDFTYSDLFPQSDDKDCWPPRLYVDDSISRWGLFDDKELFMIYDSYDIEKMVRMLTIRGD